MALETFLKTMLYKMKDKTLILTYNKKKIILSLTKQGRRQYKYKLNFTKRSWCNCKHTFILVLKNIWHRAAFVLKYYLQETTFPCWNYILLFIKKNSNN